MVPRLARARVRVGKLPRARVRVDEASRNASGPRVMSHRTRVDESILLQPDTRVRVRARVRAGRVHFTTTSGRVHFTTT